MSQDKFALGMVEYKEEDFDSTPELDSYQYSLLKKYLHGSALEIGAGAGRISKFASENKELDELLISEPSSYFFKHLENQIPRRENIKLIQSESSELAIKFRNHFDCVYSVDVMEHIEDDKKFLEDCYQMLKPGGSCIILVPALQFLYSNLDRSIGHYRRYDKGLIKKTVSQTHFRIQKMSYNNIIGALGSLWFIKIRKLDYQSPSNKKQFFFLSRIYSRFFIPVVRFVEAFFPVPFGLNMTIILSKPKSP